MGPRWTKAPFGCTDCARKMFCGLPSRPLMCRTGTDTFGVSWVRTFHQCNVPWRCGYGSKHEFPTTVAKQNGWVWRGVPHMAIVNGKTMSFSVGSSGCFQTHRPDAGWRWQDHKRWDHTGGLFPTHPVVVDDHFSVAEKDGQKMMFYRGSRLFWETSIYDQRNFTTSLRGFQCQVWVDIWLPGLLHDLNHYLSKL